MTDRELNIAEAEALLDNLIDYDLDKAERFIESMLARLALKKRASERAKQAEPVALERWGMKSPSTWPFFEKVDDGYWTPWHIANEALQRAAPPAARGEPVAWMFRYRGRFGNAEWTPWAASPYPHKPVIEHAEVESYPLYAAPPADDEAVRLLREAKAWIDHEPLVNEIIAYLDKVGK